MIFCFDTETTGLILPGPLSSPRQPRIIEFAAVLMDYQGDICEEFQILCDPGIPIPPETTAIHHITDEHVKGRRPFSDYAGRINLMMASAKEMSGHNVMFDIQMMEIEALRSGFKLEVPKHIICTVEETEWINGRRMRLADLHHYLFNEPVVEAHRAMADVRTQARCLHELRKRRLA